jgi:hypothetical protein
MAQPDQGPLTSEEFGAQWRVTPPTAIRWAQQGRVTAVRTPGGHWRFLGPLPSTTRGTSSPVTDGTEDHTDG